jgi:hypothetical protein
VCSAIERLPRKDSQILQHLESLITGGLASRRRSIVNLSIATWNKTFGKAESLVYPVRVEQALRRLRSTVELSLPSLEVRAEDSVSLYVHLGSYSLTLLKANDFSYYESEEDEKDIRRAFKSPHVKESPFKVTKTTRRSLTRSPAVPTPGSRRVSVRQTPKARLRHDNSQIQFEPIVSSPSNPFNQESQVLTERQREMLERQRLSGGLFANMGAGSSQQEAPPSPMEIHSDALTADDLPIPVSHTAPLKTLAAMGPMDAFLGSSPTPHARRSSRLVVSEDTNVATPTAVRTMHVADEVDLGSSPPRFEKDVGSPRADKNSDVRVGSRFEYRQPDSLCDVTVDEGITIDEEDVLGTKLCQNGSSDFDLTDAIMSELPSSTIDLQLTAQLDADIQAHLTVGTQDGPDVAPESVSEFVDAASHPQSSIIDIEQTDRDTKVGESQPPSSVVAIATQDAEADTSSANHIDDSFIRTSPSKDTPDSQRSRRLSRHSTATPVQSPKKKKRKQTPAKAETQAEQSKREEVEANISTRAALSDQDGMMDNIVVKAPALPQNKGKKRKLTNDAQPRAKAHTLVPETNRKRGPIRRSQSLLSQVENSQDVRVEDTPAPKRARQNGSQDVSGAKHTTTPPLGSQTKRLSYVRVSPKRSPEFGSSVWGSPRLTDVNTLEATKASSKSTTTTPLPNSQSNQGRSRPQASAGAETPSRSFTERVILTPRSIINQLRSLKDYLFSAPQFMLGRDEEKEIDDALFDIRRQVHAAGMRGEKRPREE